MLTKRDKQLLFIFGLFTFYVLLFLPSLLANQIPYFMDIITTFFPIKAYIGTLYQSFQIPLWNPTYFGGVPLLANPQWGALYPGNFPFFFCRTGWMFTLTLVLHALFGAYGIWLLCRRFSPSPFSPIAPLIFLFGGYLWAHYAFGAYILAIAWMPFIFLSYDCYLSTGRFSWVLLAGVLIGFLLLSGAPQLTFYFFIAFIFISILSFLASGSWFLVRRSFLFFAISTAVGIIIALPQIVTIIDGMRETGRHRELKLAEILPGALSARQYVAVFLGGTGAFFEDAETTAYFGMPALFILLLGLVKTLSSPKGERLFIYASLSLILLLFASRILAPILYHFFPFYAKFHDPKRILGIVMLFFPLIAVRGAEFLFSERNISGKKRVYYLISAFFLLLLLIFLNGKNSFYHPVKDFLQLGWIKVPFSLPPFWLSLFLLFLLFLLYLFFRVKSSVHIIWILLILLIDLCYFAFSRIDVKMIAAHKVFNKNLVPPELLIDKSKYRFITYDPTLNYSYDYLRKDFPQLIMPDGASFHQLEDFQGYDPWKPKRYEQYLQLLNEGFVVPWRRHFGLVRNLWWSPLLQRACVKYVIGDAGNYHLPLYPPDLLLPKKSLSLRNERVVKTKKLLLTFITQATPKEKNLLSLKVQNPGGEELIDLILGNTAEGFSSIGNEVSRKVLTETRLEIRANFAIYTWDIEFKDQEALAAISAQNLSAEHNVLITDLAFQPVDTNNRFSLIAGDEDSPTALWELQGFVFPIMGFSPKAVVAHSTTEAGQLLEKISQSTTETVVIEDIKGLLGREELLTFSPEARIISERYKSGKITAEIDTAEKPALLILRQGYSRHWRGEIDGEPHPIFPCDLMFCALIVPPEAKQIVFHYLPLWLPFLLILSGLCLATIFILLLRAKIFK